MATKHQSNCFRTIGGQRYVNYTDILCAEDEKHILFAKEMKIPHRVFKHPDGFSRLFVLEDRVKEMDRAPAPPEKSK